MKKYLIIAATALLAASACTKGYEAVDDGVGGRTNANNRDARSYMMSVADNLVTDALDELEMGLLVQDNGRGTSGHFDISGGSLLANGVAWTVIADDSLLKGLTLKCTGASTWTLTYTGDYSLLGERYPVDFTLVAAQGTLIKGHHYNWNVTLAGDRTEREGYRCKFSTDGLVKYQVAMEQDVPANYPGWNKVDGSFLMEIYKETKLVDVWQLDFAGYPSDAQFTRSL